jgi:hypothetical protein
LEFFVEPADSGERDRIITLLLGTVAQESAKWLRANLMERAAQMVDFGLGASDLGRLDCFLVA